MLKTAAQQGAQTIELEVLVENDAARHLYEKVGFVIVDDLRVWEPHGEEPFETSNLPHTQNRKVRGL